MVHTCFLAEACQHGAERELVEELWLEVETAYLAADRFFHDLAHVENMLLELQPVKSAFKDWSAVFFTVVYHDVAHNVAQNMVYNDNQERSIAFAERQLRALNFPAETIEKCRRQILATQKHTQTSDNDTNLFLDADLAILGQPWQVYEAYRKNIRKEYAIYTDSVYNRGRRKVLQYFLHMNPLFKTSYFQDLYERRAKENLQQEIQLLQA